MAQSGLGVHAIEMSANRSKADIAEGRLDVGF
jgi:hypothetical protein